MNGYDIARGALGLLMAALLFGAGSSEAWADSKDKGKGNGAAKAAAARPAAPVSRPAAPAPAPAPTARSSSVAAEATHHPGAANGVETGDGGTITTEEARMLLLSGGDGATSATVAPPVATVDPLSLITPVRRVTVPEKRAAAPGAAARLDGEDSFFPVPWPVLALLFALSQAVLVLSVRLVRRLGAEPVRHVSAAG